MNSRKRKDDNVLKKTKKQAIERDDGLCILCGRLATDIHHIVFRSQMGTSELNNLACLCRECHNKAHGVNARAIAKKLKCMIIGENE